MQSPGLQAPVAQVVVVVVVVGGCASAEAAFSSPCSNPPGARTRIFGPAAIAAAAIG
jgi:hypothetical protein